MGKYNEPIECFAFLLGDSGALDLLIFRLSVSSKEREKYLYYQCNEMTK